jgi:predicted O-methyltransferase YrrM
MMIETNDVEIPSWTEPKTFDYCAETAKRSTLMIESGTYMGASARVMLRANPKLHLWCVDKFMVFGTEQITRMFLREWIEAGRCEIIVGDMDKAFEMIAPNYLGKIDAVWVDDGHAVEDVHRDILNALPLLRERGTLFGHDFDKPHNDVAQGVLSLIPLEQLTFPVERVWQFIKP